MSKYSKELELKIVLDYIEKHIGPEQQEKAYGVSSSQIRQWIAQYKLNGKFTEPTRHFSGDFKLKSVKLSARASSFRSRNGIIFWYYKPGNNLCMEKEIYYRWYRSSVSESRIATESFAFIPSFVFCIFSPDLNSATYINPQC